MATEVFEQLAHAFETVGAAIEQIGSSNGACLNAELREIISVDELINIFAAVEHGDILTFENPLEEDLKDSKSPGPDDRTRAHDRDVQALSNIVPAQELSRKLGFAILFNREGGHFLRHRIRLGNAVNRAR